MKRIIEKNIVVIIIAISVLLSTVILSYIFSNMWISIVGIVISTILLMSIAIPKIFLLVITIFSFVVIILFFITSKKEVVVLEQVKSSDVTISKSSSDIYDFDVSDSIISEKNQNDVITSYEESEETLSSDSNDIYTEDVTATFEEIEYMQIKVTFSNVCDPDITSNIEYDIFKSNETEYIVYLYPQENTSGTAIIEVKGETIISQKYEISY